MALLAGALCVAWAIGIAGAGQLASTPDADNTGLMMYDIRVTGGDEFALLLREHSGVDPAIITERGRAGHERMAQALTRLRGGSPGAEVTHSPLTGSAEILRVHHGALTGPAHGARDGALRFLQPRGASLPSRDGLLSHRRPIPRRTA